MFRKPSTGSLVALSVHPDRVDIAKVTRNGAAPPLVEICDSVQKKNSSLETLQAVRKDFRLDQNRCGTLLSASQYQLQLLDAPAVPDAELKSAVRWSLKDLLDYPVETATIDVVMVPAGPNSTARGKSVYAVSARNSAIESVMKTFLEAKLALQVIDVPELAQRNIAALLETEGRGLALLNFDDEGGLLTFTAGGELYLSRRIEVGSLMLQQADHGRREQLFERITLELQRSLDHFDRQFSHVPLARVALGPLAEDAGLQAYLAKNLYVPVEAINLGGILDFGERTEMREAGYQQRFMPVLGAALRNGMTQ
ncbi:MAG TPA: agglutinin biogenesis protein MshI [Burkholderiales bacterium]